MPGVGQIVRNPGVLPGDVHVDGVATVLLADPGHGRKKRLRQASSVERRHRQEIVDDAHPAVAEIRPDEVGEEAEN